MNRRDVIKSLGLGAGMLVVGPATLSLLQSCKNEPEYDWQPVFLSAPQGFALKQILDIILPKTETPGANDLNIAQFIDSYMEEVAEQDQKEKFKKAANAFSAAFERDFEKGEFEGNPEDFEVIISKYLKATPAEQEEYLKRNSETQDVLEQETELKMDADAGAYEYLRSVREMAIWAWKNSEPIGEEVMWYDPIPGGYIPCANTGEVGNGNAMSL